MTDQELKEIKERLEKATPGPWSYDMPVRHYNDAEGCSREEVSEWWSVEDDDCKVIANIALQNLSDAEFIASAPEDIRRLLDEVERLRDEHKNPLCNAEG